MDVNWDQVLKEQEEEAAANVLPESDYDIVVTKAEATVASTGSPMIKLTCDVTSGPFAKKRLWTNIVLKSDSPGAMRMALRRLAGLGISREWLAEANPNTQQIAAQLVGKTANARVKQREWKGEQRNEIDMFTLAGEGDTPVPPQIGDAPTPEAILPSAGVPAPPQIDAVPAPPAVEEPAPAPEPEPEPEAAPEPEPEPAPAAPADVAADEEPF